MKREFEIADQIAFFQAAEINDTKNLSLLIEKKVGVNNCRDNNGNTALHIASLNNSTESVVTLLKKGADRNFVNLKGETALQMTQAILNDYDDPENNYEDTIKLLSAKEHISGGGVGGIAPSAVSHYEFAKNLQDSDTQIYQFGTYINNEIEKGNLDAKDQSGNTMLHYAVKFNKLEAINHLLYYGASLDNTNQESYTPLDLAILYGNNEIIKVLLKEESRRSYSATTPNRSNEVDPYLIKALIFNKSIDEDLIIGLISKMTKDDLSSEQIDGKNFLGYATENSRSEITDFLFDKIYGRDDSTTYAGAFSAIGHSPYADEFVEFPVGSGGGPAGAILSFFDLSFSVGSGGGPAGGSQKRSRVEPNSHFEAQWQSPYAPPSNNYSPSSPISFEFDERDFSPPPSPTSGRLGGSEGVGPAGGSEVRSGVNFLKPPPPPLGGPPGYYLKATQGDSSTLSERDSPPPTTPGKRKIDDKTPPPVKSGGGGRGN